MTKKYLSFDDMRVSYTPKDDTIQITSGDPDLASDGWRLVLQKHTPAELALRSRLEAANLVRVSPTERPDVVHYPHADSYSWHEFPLGIDTYGEVQTVDMQAAGSLLMLGRTGSGKSVVQRNLLAHIARHMERWQVTGVDMKRIELEPYAQLPYLGESFTLAVDMAQAVASLRKVWSLVIERHRLMDELHVDCEGLISAGRMKAHLLLVDEAYLLLTPTQSMTAEEFSLQQEAVTLLIDILRLNRRSGVYVALGTQRDPALIPTGVEKNLAAKIRMGEIPGTMKGWGTFDGEAVQFFYSEPQLVKQIVLSELMAGTGELK
jgi:hypothetical protein